MSAIKIRLAAAPAVITESVFTALRAHGYELARRVNFESGPVLVPIDETERGLVFRELGNNATQALTSIDLLGED